MGAPHGRGVDGTISPPQAHTVDSHASRNAIERKAVAFCQRGQHRHRAESSLATQVPAINGRPLGRDADASHISTRGTSTVGVVMIHK